MKTPENKQITVINTKPNVRQPLYRMRVVKSRKKRDVKHRENIFYWKEVANDE